MALQTSRMIPLACKCQLQSPLHNPGLPIGRIIEADKHTFPLLDLPPELRNEIHEQVLSTDSRFPPVMWAVCTQTRQETIPMLSKGWYICLHQDVRLGPISICPNTGYEERYWCSGKFEHLRYPELCSQRFSVICFGSRRRCPKGTTPFSLLLRHANMDHVLKHIETVELMVYTEDGYTLARINLDFPRAHTGKPSFDFEYRSFHPDSQTDGMLEGIPGRYAARPGYSITGRMDSLGKPLF